MKKVGNHMRRVVRFGLMVVAAVGLAACGMGGSAARPAQQFSVVASEFAFAPAQVTVTSGQPVEITFQNAGAVVHDWSVRAIPLAAGTTVEGGGGMMDAAHAGLTLHVGGDPGVEKRLTFVPGTPGTYEFFCTVAGHKEAGMVGTLIVKAS